MLDTITTMEQIADSGVDMGFNVFVARKRKKLRQDDLAELVGIRQADLSALENQKLIENEELLEKLAKELETTVNYFKTTKFDEILGGNRVQYNDQQVTGASESKDVVNQGYEFEQNFNYVTPELKEVQEALIREKDARLEESQKINDELKTRVRELEGMLNEIVKKTLL